MLGNVNNYFLVVYTDSKGEPFVRKYAENPRIRIVLMPIEEFYNYKYKEQWIANHANNPYLNQHVSWEVNMLWAEKAHFVANTINQGYFSDNVDVWYGWCDIGYFREGPHNMQRDELTRWPNETKIANLNPAKIYYGCVNNNSGELNDIIRKANNRTPVGLPAEPLPPRQISIAGGFFLSKRDNIEWWKSLFDKTLALYFDNHYLVKDDQMVIASCIFTNMDRFVLFMEDSPPYDNWFMFQRHLS